jgi:hypothetical protein
VKTVKSHGWLNAGKFQRIPHNKRLVNCAVLWQYGTGSENRDRHAEHNWQSQWDNWVRNLEAVLTKNQPSLSIRAISGYMKKKHVRSYCLVVVSEIYPPSGASGQDGKQEYFNVQNFNFLSSFSCYVMRRFIIRTVRLILRAWPSRMWLRRVWFARNLPILFSRYKICTNLQNYTVSHLKRPVILIRTAIRTQNSPSIVKVSK